MKIDSDKIQEIIESAREKGIEVRLRDVACHSLSRTFGDNTLAYKIIFAQNASDGEVTAYFTGRVQDFLRSWFRKENSADSISESLSFEENRGALIAKLDEIKSLAATGDIPMKDAVKLEIDIRSKLNDKFQVQDEDKGTIVMVPPKYNFICPKTRTECYIYDKEYAKKTFHLIEDPDFNGQE